MVSLRHTSGLNFLEDIWLSYDLKMNSSSSSRFTIPSTLTKVAAKRYLVESMATHVSVTEKTGTTSLYIIGIDGPYRYVFCVVHTIIPGTSSWDMVSLPKTIESVKESWSWMYPLRNGCLAC